MARIHFTNDQPRQRQRLNNNIRKFKVTVLCLKYKILFADYSSSNLGLLDKLTPMPALLLGEASSYSCADLMKGHSCFNSFLTQPERKKLELEKWN